MTINIENLVDPAYLNFSHHDVAQWHRALVSRNAGVDICHVD